MQRFCFLLMNTEKIKVRYRLHILLSPASALARLQVGDIGLLWPRDTFFSYTPPSNLLTKFQEVGEKKINMRKPLRSHNSTLPTFFPPAMIRVLYATAYLSRRGKYIYMPASMKEKNKFTTYAKYIYIYIYRRRV